MECFLQKSNRNTLMKILQEDSIVKLSEHRFMNSKERPFISHTLYIYTHTNTHTHNLSLKLSNIYSGTMKILNYYRNNIYDCGDNDEDDNDGDEG